MAGNTRGRKPKNQEVESQEVASTKPEPRVRKEIDRNLVVPCRNVTSGILVYVSNKTGATVIWSEFGDTEWIDVGELLTMKASQAKFLSEPWLLVDDVEVAEYLGLTAMYEKIVPIDDIEPLLTEGTSSEVDAVLKNAPKGTRDLIGDMARKLIEEERLNDVRIIKVLEKELGIDLSIVID